ncbi:MAG TPA: RpiB/LacA/LacB family sugar-phosphate isomerase [Acidobacteriota bacterium]|nr:RpiB/LacA/LacB family sugar-phosphate isomerase [Acidobacteriota bacterium]
MRVVLGSDHPGFEMKEVLLTFVRGLGHEVLDIGTNSTAPVDHPDFAEAVGTAVQSSLWSSRTFLSKLPAAI